MLLALSAVGACSETEDVRTVVSDLLAVRNPVTVGEWLRTHPGGVFQDASAIESSTTFGNNSLREIPTFCGIVSSKENRAGTLTIDAFFRIPDATSLHLPTSDSTQPGLLKQCVLSGMRVEMYAGRSADDALFTSIEHDLSRALGPGEPSLPAASASWEGSDAAGHGSSRWLITVDKGFTAQAITAAARALLTNERNPPGIFIELHRAHTLAESAGLPRDSVREMQQLITKIENWQHGRASIQSIDLQQIAPFLVRWVEASRHLPPARKAAGLFAADLVTGCLNIPASIDRVSQKELDEAIIRVKAQLATAGAHFHYDELGRCYSYDHDWVQEAVRRAPHSAAGKQAFLFILDRGFVPGGCPSDGSEVIARAPSYLREYSDPEIRAHISLALADAYRDRIAVVNGANGDPFQQADDYKRTVHEDYSQALRWYRESIKASPGSESAQRALTQAWALLAGLKPLDTRFVCIYD